MVYLVVFVVGIAFGFVIGNRKYRKKLGQSISAFGDWMSNTAGPKSSKEGSWTAPTKGSEISKSEKGKDE